MIKNIIKQYSKTPTNIIQGFAESSIIHFLHGGKVGCPYHSLAFWLSLFLQLHIQISTHSPTFIIFSPISPTWRMTTANMLVVLLKSRRRMFLFLTFTFSRWILRQACISNCLSLIHYTESILHFNFTSKLPSRFQVQMLYISSIKM